MVSKRRKILHWWRRRSLQRRVAYILIGVFLVIYLAYRQQASAGVYESGGVLLLSILNINIVALCALAFLVGRNVVKLVFDRRRGLLGSGLKLKLVTAFVGLALVPTALSFLLASGFLSQVMERIFSDQLDGTAKNAVYIAKEHTNLLKTNVRRAGLEIQNELATQPLIYKNEVLFDELLKTVIEHHQLSAIEFFKINKKRLVLSKHFAAKDNYYKSRKYIELDKISSLSQAEGQTQAFIENTKKDHFVRSYTLVEYQNHKLLLVCSAEISLDLFNALDSVHKAFQEHEQLKLFHAPLRSGYLVTLALITALVIFAAIWIAFYIAKDLSGPIAALLEGTKAIAAGRYSHRIRVTGSDELSLLTKAFNQMSADLYSTTRDSIARRKFIEAIQAQLAVGVIVITTEYKITSINMAALHIFAKLDHDQFIGKNLSDFFNEDCNDQISDLLQKLDKQSQDSRATMSLRREQILKVKINNEDRRILLTAGVLESDLLGSGYLLLFDDVTDLVKAQEVVAWREVARRIAHEIKNPLTPLQLTVQRLQKALPKDIDPSIVKLSATILEQVHSIKRLADEFSRFARMPVVNFQQTDIHDLISDLLSDFAERNPDIIFQYLPDQAIDDLFVDKEQIRRAIFNIIDNAIHALLEQVSTKSQKIIIRTRKIGSSVFIEISDNGPGVSAADADHIFEPYFTKAPGGTGLGLSIVESIIREHNGQVHLDRNYKDGAKFVIELPATAKESTKRKIVL